MKKKIMVLLVICIVTLSGCNSVIELEGRNDDLIAEYAAGLMAKYTYESLKPKPFNRADYYPNGTPTAESVTNSESTTDENGSEAGTEVQTTYNTNEEFAAFINLGCDISLIGYEICDTYPTGNTESYYSMTAAGDNVLLVIHYNVTNNTGADVNVNTLSNQKEYKLTVNAKTKIKVQDTILPEDLQNLNEVVAAGQSADRILVFQTGRDTCDDVKSLMLTVSDDNGSINLNLK